MPKRLREWRVSRARARAEQSPSTDEKFAKQAHDLDALRKTVEDASAVSAGFWLSYLFVLFYIGIAAGAVTHRDLLLENPVKLPFLSDVPLPLVAFFFLAPIVFIVSHAYTLVHFVMLAAKVGVFDTELRAQLGDAPETRDAFRRQLPSNIFVQFLAGPRDIRESGIGLILKAIAWFSLVIGPVLLLLLIQVRFLPYHLEWLTWAHRLAILADLILLWLLWAAVLNSRSKLMWRLARTGKGWRSGLALTGRYIAGLTACLVPIGLAFTAATFPGERMDEWIGERQWIPPNRLTAWLGQEDSKHQPEWTSVHNLLFNSRFYEGYSHNESLFATTLMLSGFDALQAAKIDDSKKLDTVKPTLILSKRHLEGADFLFADLRKADLKGAQLQGALLMGAQLQGASLNGAQLQGAGLELAILQGASLNGAQLQGASLYLARLQGASLDTAKLQGASLFLAQLQGASLKFAELQGASLEKSDLRGAGLDGAQLQGAALDEAQLQGASLVFAQLQGASLAGASLQGASLDWAQLQGASLERANLAGANLGTANAWRARFSVGSIEAFYYDRTIVWDSKQKKDFFSDPEPWTETTYSDLKKMIEAEVGAGPRVHAEQPMSEWWGSPAPFGRDAALKRIGILDPNKPFEFEAERPKWKKKIVAKAIPAEDSDKARARELKALVCSGDADAVYIVRGLVTIDRIKATGDQAPGLVEAILKPDCPVSAALTQADKAALNKQAKEARAPAGEH
jgi:uncharacterized protein YjbI with pentapeptide repeats